MNTCHRMTALLAACLFLPALALAENSGWYAAADAGRSNFTGTADLNSADYAPPSKNTDSGYRLSAGYQFDQYFGLEADYVDFGQVTGNTAHIGPYPPPGINTCGYLCQFSYDINLNLKSRGWVLVFTGTYPFTEQCAYSTQIGPGFHAKVGHRSRQAGPV